MTSVPLPLSVLDPDPAQPRKTVSPDELARLAASIHARGLLQPLRVRPADAQGRHAVLVGHRRLAALLLNGVTHADCVVAEGPQDEAAVLAEQLAENLLREDLSPVEEAEGYRRYMSLKQVTAGRAAEELDVPPARLSRLLPILDLPAAVRERVHRGEVPRDTAYHLARLPEGA